MNLTGQLYAVDTQLRKQKAGPKLRQAVREAQSAPVLARLHKAIESNSRNYYVQWPDGIRTEVRVVDGSTGKYLRTDKDSTERNNLDDLPDS